MGKERKQALTEPRGRRTKTMYCSANEDGGGKILSPGREAFPFITELLMKDRQVYLRYIILMRLDCKILARQKLRHSPFWVVQKPM